jgi:tRNA dimethylallyltransferase
VNTSSSPDKPELVVVVGATATGKTAVGVELALALDGEIVNGDSRLFYRGMDVATAKPTLDEMKGVPHHLIDILDPNEQYSLASYLKNARSGIEEISSRGKIPIIVGGSGQYIWALIEGWEVPEIEPNIQLREELENQLAAKGVETLAAYLISIAPAVATETDLLNPRRVIRAIERVLASTTDTAPIRKKAEEPPFNSLVIGLAVERSVLHQRVLNRLDNMLENNWKSEVESLLSAGYSTDDRAMSGIGYRQMIAHLNDEYDLQEAVRKSAVATNRLIRQQNNWFKQSDPRIHWFDMTQDPLATTNSLVIMSESWHGGNTNSSDT